MREDIINEHVSFELPGVPPPGEEWRSWPELPAAHEILQPLNECEKLPENPVHRPWNSKAEYLNAQYKILRREGTESLRASVNSFKMNPEMTDNQDTCVYTEVFVKGYLMTKMGPLCQIEFSIMRAGRKIRWQQSRRLTPGTMLALSTNEDRFRSICKVAIVAQRPFYNGLDQQPPVIDIMWARSEDAIINPNEKLVMIEARGGYFESVRHALVGLQHAALEESPIDKYHVHGDVADSVPPSIQNDGRMDISSLVQSKYMEDAVDLEQVEAFLSSMKSYDVFHQGIHLPPGASNLDDSQKDALERMLTKELAIVQGPPGTGKTYTSVQALKVLARSRPRGDPPIIVAAQTNHALDQLLVHCHDANLKILRVGGRTENDIIKSRSLFNLRRHKNFPGEEDFVVLDGLHRANVKMIRTLFENLFSNETLAPGALFEAGFITEKQMMSLLNDEWETSDSDTSPKGPLGVWLGDKCIHSSALRARWPEFADEEVDDVEDKHNVELDFDFANFIDEEEEEKGRLRGTWIPLNQQWTCRAPRVTAWRAKCVRYLETLDDLWEIPADLRGGVYLVLQERVLALQSVRFRDQLEENKLLCQKLKGHKWVRDCYSVENLAIDIIGCTTTGLTKYRGFLSAMQPRVLLVEEAAETRESNITSALYPSLQQLILVGDHQQLTPHCDLRVLGSPPFNLNVSLFERLADKEKMGLPYKMLSQQRRMRPELRKYLSPFYPGLTDHPIVEMDQNRPPVPGMGGRNSWWFDHRSPEAVDADRSKFNEFEAEMITKFVAYLLQNGVDAKKITVLTFYNGQRKLILRKLKRETAIGGSAFFNVFTVDAYQGEENDIILLSLVRSPRPATFFNVGFLEDKNRATVAISRARRGFYVFGNVQNLILGTPALAFWRDVLTEFKAQGHFPADSVLPLVCANHDNEIEIREPNDFVRTHGGCFRRCGGGHPCGHACQLNCHPMPHEKLRCHEPCEKRLFCGHRCGRRCFECCFCKCEVYQSHLRHATAIDADPFRRLEDVLRDDVEDPDERKDNIQGVDKAKAKASRASKKNARPARVGPVGPFPMAVIEDSVRDRGCGAGATARRNGCNRGGGRGGGSSRSGTPRVGAMQRQHVGSLFVQQPMHVPSSFMPLLSITPSSHQDPSQAAARWQGFADNVGAADKEMRNKQLTNGPMGEFGRMQQPRLVETFRQTNKRKPMDLSPHKQATSNFAVTPELTPDVSPDHVPSRHIRAWCVEEAVEDIKKMTKGRNQNSLPNRSSTMSSIANNSQDKIAKERNNGARSDLNLILLPHSHPVVTPTPGLTSHPRQEWEEESIASPISSPKTHDNEEQGVEVEEEDFLIDFEDHVHTDPITKGVVVVEGEDLIKF